MIDLFYATADPPSKAPTAKPTRSPILSPTESPTETGYNETETTYEPLDWAEGGSGSVYHSG